ANELLWRMNRKRLELEPLRDAMLAASGLLDLTAGGRPVDIADEPNCRRRTLYLAVKRENLPSFFRAFDFANPDLHVSARHETTVPQQALFLLNGPFVAEQPWGAPRVPKTVTRPSLSSRQHRLWRQSVRVRRPPGVMESATGTRPASR